MQSGFAGLVELLDEIARRARELQGQRLGGGQLVLVILLQDPVIHLVAQRERIFLRLAVCRVQLDRLQVFLRIFAIADRLPRRIDDH